MSVTFDAAGAAREAGMNLRASYVVLTVAVFVLPITGAITLSTGPVASPTAAAVTIASLAAIVVLFRREWAWDRRAAAMYAVALTATMVITCGAVVAWFEGATRGVAGALGAAALAVTVWLGSVLWREARFEDLLPDWLLAEFPKDQVYEDDGVEWCARAEGTDVSQGVTVRVYLQNNIEAEREVRLRLHDESGIFSLSGRVNVSELAPATLPARGHAVLTATIAARDPRPIRDVRIFVIVRATGPAAERNRRRRAPPGIHPTPRWMVVIAPFGGHLILRRGGVYLRMRASGGAVPEHTQPTSTLEHLAT